MFWGLIMEPQRRYTQVVKKSFHISMAALDISSSTDEPVQVMCGLDGKNYLLCTLQKNNELQCILDLNFEEGKEVSFACGGNSHVHLTGYLIEEELVNEMDDDVDSEEEVDEQSTHLLEGGSPAKKKKKNLPLLVSSTNDSFESDTDDSDFVLDEVDEDVGEEEEDDGEGEEEADSDEEESDDEVDEAEEDEKPIQQQKKAKNESVKLNGIDKKNAKKEKPTISTKENAQSSKKRTLQGGVIVEDLKEGQGKSAKNGKFVTVFYEGRLKQNNKLFDSTTKGAGFSFRLGGGEVIKGWDIGVAGMKQGGKRRITCPPHMAYGKKGSPPAIPPNSTLVFDVELRKC